VVRSVGGARGTSIKRIESTCCDMKNSFTNQLCYVMLSYGYGCKEMQRMGLMLHSMVGVISEDAHTRLMLSISGICESC